MDDPRLWIALRDTPGLGRARARALLARFATPHGVFGRPAAELAVDCPLEVALRLERGPELEGPGRELERADRLGLRVLLQGRPGFPRELGDLEDPPLLLYLDGELPRGVRLAVVGARRPTARSRQLTGELVAPLVRAGGVVVSGLAYGIDAAAHRGALDAGGATLAVLASGVDRPGPHGNRGLARRILAHGGGLLSEFPPGRPALPHHFPDRNRLISGLSSATLVVEARERSGSLVTARHAREQGRKLLVVPGPVDVEHCRGSNRLLKEVAVAVLDGHDLLEEVDPRAALRLRDTAAPAESAGARRVLDELAAGPLDPDALARALGLPVARLAPLLLELELAGRIARVGSRLARSGAPGAGRARG